MRGGSRGRLEMLNKYYVGKADLTFGQIRFWIVILAQAGIQKNLDWIPACAGMTESE